MKTYKTAQLARLYNMHPNTVRFYEEMGLLSKPPRTSSGYRIFTQLHAEQLCLIRIALRGQVLVGGLRDEVFAILKAAAAGDDSQAEALTEEYRRHIVREQDKAEEALQIVHGYLSGAQQPHEPLALTRAQTARLLEVTVDTLRNWEMNGLLTVKRTQNGYRVYTHRDIHRLKVIRELRGAGYSLSAILRMFSTLSHTPASDPRAVLDTPGEHEDIVGACDRLLTALNELSEDARQMAGQLAVIRRLKRTL